MVGGVEGAIGRGVNVDVEVWGGRGIQGCGAFKFETELGECRDNVCHKDVTMFPAEDIVCVTGVVGDRETECGDTGMCDVEDVKGHDVREERGGGSALYDASHL